MKIDNIIKKALIERGLISEQVVDNTTQQTGRETRSFDLNNPQQVLNAAQQYDCWKQWGLKEKPIDATFKQEYRFSFRGNVVTVKPNETYLLGPNKLVFLGRQAEGESDKDNTYFYGFDGSNIYNNLFQGFRWKCNSLRNVDQAGTRNITPAQQKLLDDFLDTYGSVYTKVGGQGKVAKDISELTYKDKRSIWDENVGVPPKGNFVYVQETLYNVEPNQLIAVADYLKNNGYSLEVPPMNDPAFSQGISLINIFPKLKQYNLPADVKVYPTKATFAPTRTTNSGDIKVDKNACTVAIKYLTTCLKNSGQSEPCQDVKQRMKNVDTASMCYLNLTKEKANNPTKLLGGIFGPEDELMRLVNVSNNIYGIAPRIRELKSSVSMNESKRIDSTIKKHLLESIRTKNSLI
jgi:hypothetical protein